LSSTGQYARLETTGRRTGRPHDVIVRYVIYDNKMVVFPMVGGRQDWVANIEQNPTIVVYSGKSRWNGTAKMMEVADLDDPVLGAFQRKYGVVEVKRRYWGQKKFVEIQLESKSEEDVKELIYDDLEAAFDGVAETYDRHILGNPMNLWLRNRSVRLLTGVFGPGDTLVEIGCGTGTETLRLAKAGITVIAVDISSRMLDMMMKKARAEGLERRVVPVHCRPYEVKRRVGEAGYRAVDGAYSTYGAVNTEPSLGLMFADLHGLIKPGGRLVLGVWNKYCAYEMFGYALRMKPTMSVARLRNPVPVGKSRFCVTTNSFSVDSLDKYVGDLFTREKVVGVEIILPPSNLIRYLPRGPVLGWVERAEIALEPRYPWNRLGDHFLAVYRRNG